jgi:hypothetical protein
MLFSTETKTVFRVRSASYITDTLGIKWMESFLTPGLHLTAWLRMSGAIPLLLYAFTWHIELLSTGANFMLKDCDSWYHNVFILCGDSPYLLNTHFKYTFLTTPKPFKQSLSLWFSYKIPVWNSLLSCACNMPRSCHPPWLTECTKLR